jgi:hypothetical protein
MDHLHLHKLLEMTPERIARNQQVAYNIIQAWKCEAAERIAETFKRHGVGPGIVCASGYGSL